MTMYSCVEYIESAVRRVCLKWGAALCYVSAASGANVSELRLLLRHELLQVAGKRY